MKVEFRSIEVPVHWRALAQIIERVAYLPRQVKLVVREGQMEFLDARGSEIPVSVPKEFAGEALAETKTSVHFLAWLGETFRPVHHQSFQHH